ncbi:MAG TPA: DinB family protein, partial [Promineifilum sp.]|nr:DinB family protein [Promineifilum sp.]
LWAVNVADGNQALVRMNVGADIVNAFLQGAGAMAEGRLPLYNLIPHPHVCRTCGHLLLDEPAAQCPTCGAWPGTYQRFMPTFWLEALEPPAALARLRQTPLEVEQLLTSLSETQMNQTPPDGGWAIRHVLIHLRDAQDVLAFRLDLFRQAENPALESKAGWTWAAAEDERPPSAQEIFAAYKASRSATVASLEQLPLTHWWRAGRHEEFGVVTLKQQVSYFATHELIHLPQLERLRRRFTAAG